MYDIVICGAGVAGCSFARNAASKGLKVLLLDKILKKNLGMIGGMLLNRKYLKIHKLRPLCLLND